MTNVILKSISDRDKLYIRLKALSINDRQYENTLINFKTYNRLLHQTIRSAKRMYFQNCFSKYKTDIKETWATINSILNKSKRNNNYPREFLINGIFQSDENKIANEFNKYFIEIGPNLSQNIITPHNRSFKDYLKTPINTKFVFNQICENDVIKALDKLKPKTSCNQDKISNKLLKYVKHELAWPLMYLINQTFEHGIFPNQLKTAKVTPIFKKNENYLFSNYRPVSVLSSVSKVFERIMHDQIYKHFDDLKLLFNSQYGFRPKHSTEFAALELIDRIILEMDKNNIPINIFMDLSKAFDTLDHQILLHKLKYYGFSDKSYELMDSYLNDRMQYVEFNTCKSNLLKIQCGVPQGSILGPLLFIIYLNDIPLATKFLTPVLYADDTTLFATFNNDNFRTINHEINNELKHISEWLKLNKLSLNTEKTKAMLFHSCQRNVNICKPEIFIDDIKINFVKEFNFLGLILDENLRWKYHIDFLSKKISKTIGILARLKHSLPSETLLNIYNALILSHLNYGTTLWGGQSNKLIKMQKKCIRIITNSKFNAHTTLLFKKLNLLRLEDICALHDYKLCYKIMNNLTPEYFKFILSSNNTSHGYNTRHTDDLRLPAVRHEFARNAIKYKLRKIYNNMPDNFREKIYTHSYFGFNFYIKTRFLQGYVENCNRLNCYICQN